MSRSIEMDIIENSDQQIENKAETFSAKTPNVFSSPDKIGLMQEDFDAYLFSQERLDASSPDLWPEQSRSVKFSMPFLP